MKSYLLRFGSGDPRAYTGLAPTMLIFSTTSGTTLVSPGISEALAGSGIYYFNWGTTTSIAFLADAATTSPGTSGRYVTGNLDPADRTDEYGTTLQAFSTTMTVNQTTELALIATSVALGITAVALGITAVAIGTTLTALSTTLTGQFSGIGSTASSFGTNIQDPVDLFGYLKRIQENLEGNSTYTKASGSWSIFSRGSSQLLITKTMVNGQSFVTKT